MPNKNPYLIIRKNTPNLFLLKHRITTLLIALVFFIGSLQLVPYIPKGLFDNRDIALQLFSD